MARAKDEDLEKSEDSENEEEDERNMLKYPLPSPSSLLRRFHRGELDRAQILYNRLVKHKMERLLTAQMIFPFSGFSTKEMCEAYVLIAPEYMPVVEWLRENSGYEIEVEEEVGKKETGY